MAKYEKAKFKPTNTQLNKLKYAAKYKTGKSLRITNKKKKKKSYEKMKDEKLCRWIISNIKANDERYKLTKALLSKIIQSVGFL